MHLSVCVCHFLTQDRALGPRDGSVALPDRGDGLIVDLRVLVHEPIGKAADEARLRDARGRPAVATGEHRDRLADDGGPALHGRADRATFAVGGEVDTGRDQVDLDAEQFAELVEEVEVGDRLFVAVRRTESDHSLSPPACASRQSLL